ncbi:hypothetical protein ACQ4PT_024485 [Festuca glaucescens]
MIAEMIGYNIAAEGRFRMTSVRLSPNVGGDHAPSENPLNPTPIQTTRVLDSDKRVSQRYSDEILPQIPHRSTRDPQNFLPIEFKNRLRSIISRSPNPKRCIAHIRERIAESGWQDCRLKSAPAISPRDVPPPIPVISAPIKHTQEKIPPAAIYSPIPVVLEINPLQAPPMPMIPPRFNYLDGHQWREQSVRRSNGCQVRRPTARCGALGGDHARLHALLNQRDPDPGGLIIKQQDGEALPHQQLCAIPTMENTAQPAASRKETNTARTNPAEHAPMSKGGTSSASAGSLIRAKGKEVVQELGTAKEKKVLVWNIAKVRDVKRVRFMIVGVFLSILSISTRTLVDNMKRIWQLRGRVDINERRDRRFVVEFSEKGDFDHVTSSGPWKFRGDAVLVEELKEGEDPDNFVFTTIPIWAQFHKIPFYLLSKELAVELGSEIGEYISIDNDARGDIFAKIIRARVRIDISQPLQRWVTIRDGVAEEDVVVWVAYERLPNFCNFCGIIGHQVAECRLPEADRKKRYEEDIGVPPTHPDDPRRYPIPEKTGQPPKPQALPWRAYGNRGMAQGRAAPQRQLAIIAHVAEKVGKLTMNEQPTINHTKEKGAIVDSHPTPKTAIVQGQEQNGNNLIIDFPAEDAGAASTLASPTTAESGHLQQENTDIDILIKGKGGPTSTTPPAEGTIARAEPEGKAKASEEAIDTNPKKKPLKWKRQTKGGGGSVAGNMIALTTQGGALGAPRPRDDHDDEDLGMRPGKKKYIFPVPSLEDCLGAENLRKLIAEERAREAAGEVELNLEGEGSVPPGLHHQNPPGDKQNGDKETEATSNAEAGNLTGANDRACQEP